MMFTFAAYEEGEIEATMAPTGNAGIIFGAVGIDTIKDSTASTANVAGVKFYYAGFIAPGKIALYADDKDDAGMYTLIQEAAIADIDDNYDASADVTIKVEFTKDGKITLYANGNKAFTVEGYIPFGTQIGMMVDVGNGFTPGVVVVDVKHFSYGDKFKA